MSTVSLKLQQAAVPAQLPAMPIEPVEWIKEGNPEARGAVLNQSADKRLSSGIWSCTPGKFEWRYTWDEFVQVLEGEVVITEDGGESYTLKPGDCVHFPKGLHAHWNVVKTVRKFFVLSTDEPLTL